MFQFFSILIHLINLVTIMYMVFKEKRSANSIIAWTLILYIAPLLGFIVFLMIGRRINNSKIFNVKESELKIFEKYKQQVAQTNISDLPASNMIMAIENLEYCPFRNDNEVELFSDGQQFFDSLLENLKKAQKSINIQFYIFRRDEIGNKILDILIEKAKSGVEVRFLYDSVGSRSLTKERLRDLIAVGGKVGEFFPAWLRLININMNFRNHRKIVVIDRRIGYIGGFNVGDEYLGKDAKFGYWRDTHIKFTGSSVKDLNLRFLADWRYATKEDISLHPVLPDLTQNNQNIGMQIVSSGPNTGNKHEIKLSYLKMIQRAKKYIYIQSPYLIIDKSIADSLKLAAISGVDVRVMIPGKGDHPFVYWANLGYAGEVLNYGVKIYHYDKDAFLHAKTVVIDDEVCSVGTANMDTRSFELNFEVNAIIYSEEIAKQQKNQFEADILKSTELTLTDYKNRSTIVKIKESLSRLFSGVL
ncbi:cardiolipin synthase [Turicibacter sanguinis]|uniref:cardiolipin synthase n=1 Tax=Turicibacter sanguinis TaxID=154288 RepID=UPI0039926964